MAYAEGEVLDAAVRRKVRMGMSESHNEATVTRGINDGAIFNVLAKPWSINTLKELIANGSVEYDRHSCT